MKQLTNEILEGNRIIAEFCGLTHRVLNGHLLLSNDGGRSWYGKLYNEDWNQLLPVWLKCKEIGLWMMCNGYDALWLEKGKEIETAIVNEIDCKKACLKISHLITWYNTLSPTPANG